MSIGSTELFEVDEQVHHLTLSYALIHSMFSVHFLVKEGGEKKSI